MSFLKKFFGKKEHVPEVDLPFPDVTVEEAKELVDKGIAILDIRTPKEYNHGHIKGAQLINFYEPTFKDELAKLDPKKEYLMFCEAGGRSQKSLKFFDELGFVKVYHFRGGMWAWRDEEYPLEE